MTPPRKRIIRIVLTDRERQVCKPALDPVRETLRPANLVVRVDKSAEVSPDEPRRAANEHLEAAALRMAAAELDERARRIAEANAGLAT